MAEKKKNYGWKKVFSAQGDESSGTALAAPQHYNDLFIFYIDDCCIKFQYWPLCELNIKEEVHRNINFCLLLCLAAIDSSLELNHFASELTPGMIEVELRLLV